MLGDGMAKQMNLTIRITLGLVFFVGGGLKIYSPNEASALVSSMIGLGLSSSDVMVYTVSGTEAILGVLLMLGIRKRAILAFLAIMLMVFTLTALTLAEAGQSCGCFGNLLPSAIDEVFFLRNTALLAASLFLLWHEDLSAKEELR